MQKLKYNSQNIYQILRENPHGVDWKKKTYSMNVDTLQEKQKREEQKKKKHNEQEERWLALKSGSGEMKCSFCDKTIIRGQQSYQLDKKFYNAYNACFQCAMDIESKFRFLNMWESYQKFYMLANMLSQVRDSIQWYKELQTKTKWQDLINSYGETQKVQIPNEQEYIAEIQRIITQLKEYKEQKLDEYLISKKQFIDKFDDNQSAGMLPAQLNCPYGRNLDRSQFDSDYWSKKHNNNANQEVGDELHGD